MDSSEPSLKRQRLDGLLDADPNAKAVADIISTPDLDTPWAGWATVESEPVCSSVLSYV